MTILPRQILNIVSDDEKYIRQVSPSTVSDEVSLKFFTIPRSSFTAFRLLHTSPIELSLCSKVVLLGGVPAHWFREYQRNSLRDAALHIGSTRLQKNANKLISYGYRKFHKRTLEGPFDSKPSKSKPAPPQSAFERHLETAEERRRNEVISKRNRSKTFSIGTASPQAQKKRSNSLAVIPSLEPVRKANDSRYIRSRPMTQRHTMTVAGVPERRFQNDKQDIGRFKKDLYEVHGLSCPMSAATGSSNDLSDLATDHGFNKNCSFYSGNDQSEALSSMKVTQLDDNCSHRSPIFKNASEESHQHDENGFLPKRTVQTNCKTINKVKNYKSDDTRHFHKVEPSRSDTLPEDSFLDKLWTNETTPLSMSGSLSSTECTKLQTKKTGALKLKFADQDSPDVPRAMKKKQTVRLKPTCNSNEAEALRIVIPEPHEPQARFGDHKYKTHFKSERIAVKKAGRLGERVRAGMTGGVADIFRKDYSVSSPFFRKLKRGRIVLAEKMLVMVKTAVNKKDPVLNFSEVESIDTRVSERWKEYIVVARSAGKGDSSLLLQFYRHRHIPTKVTKPKDVVHGTALDFHVDNKCVVGVYSALDRTICIQKPDDKYCDAMNDGVISSYNDFSPLKIYILRCNTLVSTGKWHHMLSNATRIKTHLRDVTFRIPEVDISVRMRLEKEVIHELAQIETNEVDKLKVCRLPRGYRVLQYPLMRYITVAVFEEMNKAGLIEVIKKWDSANVVMGCDYKHYDLLYWCSGSRSISLTETYQLFSSHLLEYRPFVQYPRELSTYNARVLLEPASIEGFLIRLNNRFGTEKNVLRKVRFKPSYFFTSDNLLFFMSSFKSMPPLPSNALMEGTETRKELLRRKKIVDCLPSIYEQDPYPLDLGSHIDWLDENLSEDDFKHKDLYAFKCFNRRVTQILKAEGAIDLIEIKRVYQGSADDIEGSEITYQLLRSAQHSFWQTEIDSIGEAASSVLSVVTTSNLVLKLLAPNPAVCKEWVVRLQGLVEYWKARKATDTEKIRVLKIHNLQQLKIDDEEDSNINERTPKWIINRGASDANIYNVNALSVLRPLLHKGIMYQKPKKHATFSKYFVILIPGFLILYSCFRRSTTGFAKDILDHKHYLTISLSDCYIYSGATTKLDMLNRDHKFNELNPQSRSLPRAYSDGWRSTEDESARCFTLWFGKKRAMYHKKIRQSKKQADVDLLYEREDKECLSNLEKNPNFFRMVSRLGVSGKSMVFMARSRQEKNLWVLSINYELERLRKKNLNFE